MTNNEASIHTVYHYFNLRDIPVVLSMMCEDVKWPNGWEGGYVNGHNEVQEYWTRQWKEIDPKVEPLAIEIMDDETLKVSVHQLVKDKDGKVISDGMVYHLYQFDGELIRSMEIENFS